MTVQPRQSRVREDARMDTSTWIAHVDRLRDGDELLERGYWHGYLDSFESGGTPMRGRFYLVRWKQPTVAVSHNDPGEVVRLAQQIEAALNADESGIAASDALRAEVEGPEFSR